LLKPWAGRRLQCKRRYRPRCRVADHTGLMCNVVVLRMFGLDWPFSELTR